MTEEKKDIEGATVEGSEAGEGKTIGASSEATAKGAGGEGTTKVPEGGSAEAAPEAKAGEAGGGEKPKPKPKKKAPKPPKVPGLVVSSSPHLITQDSIPKIMHNVILALVPAVFTSVYFFGWVSLAIIVVAVVTCMVTELLCQKLVGKPHTLSDGSAVITGMLLGLTLPPSFPLLGVVLGGVFAIAVGKMIFGGLGFNIFNPALLGRAFLQATYPVLITTWDEPVTVESAVEVVSAATPLALMKFEGVFVDNMSMFIGNTAGSLGETSAIALIIGGLYLRYKGYINWKLPLGFLGSMLIFGELFHLIDSTKYPSGLFHLFAGGVMLAAWFMVTDMVTSPVTDKGQWIFAVGAGFIAVIIRLFGGLPEGVMYAVLLMNSAVPLINTYTRPKIFGQVAPESELEETGGGAN